MDGVLETIPDDEVEKARNYVALSFPSPFATVPASRPTPTPATPTAPGRHRERPRARRPAYVAPEQMAVGVVGDREVIEADVRALDLGPVTTLTIDDVLGPAE